MDQHLEAMDRVKVATPPADSFRLPHIQRLAKTPKVNPVHEAHRGTSPPVHAPLQPEMPEWLGLEKGWVLVGKKQFNLGFYCNPGGYSSRNDIKGCGAKHGRIQIESGDQVDKKGP